jgi:hypothetical protein
MSLGMLDRMVVLLVCSDGSLRHVLNLRVPYLIGTPNSSLPGGNWLQV